MKHEHSIDMPPYSHGVATPLEDFGNPVRTLVLMGAPQQALLGPSLYLEDAPTRPIIMHEGKICIGMGQTVAGSGNLEATATYGGTSHHPKKDPLYLGGPKHAKAESKWCQKISMNIAIPLAPY